jgi:hypothetical protein
MRFNREIDAVKITRLQSGEGEGGFTQGLAGDGAGIDTSPAEFVMAVD